MSMPEVSPFSQVWWLKWLQKYRDFQNPERLQTYKAIGIALSAQSYEDRLCSACSSIQGAQFDRTPAHWDNDALGHQQD